ncbi:hypothetical protein C9994_12375 [Marivirga lumbricoides]|uniref:Peptidase M56 domain-containing protein n=1 Tax=Marivirga lumbricoides TaxID=1046115 RepID=A0A2T4DJY8_9BACT|nr:hypothetical protein C9994_12375 [Marivirga lumbricoides]
MTFGLFKPVILFPLGFFTTLPADQIEAIILHELYHIKHRDYLINILVMSLQVIFFYHPLVWKLTKILEEERENLRDDAVIEYTRNPFTYAKALLNVEELIDQPTRMSLYFSKEPSQLNKRIMRILDKNPARKSSVKPFLSLIILAFFMMSFSWLTLNESKSDKSAVFEASSAAESEINSNSQDLNTDNFDLSEVKSSSTTFFQQIQNLYPNAGLEALTDPAVFMNGKKVEQSANVHELIDVEKNNIIKAYLPSVVPDEYKMYAKRGVVLIKNEEPVADLVAVSKTEEVKVEKQVQEEQSKSSTSVERPLMFRTMRIATNIGPIEEEHAVEEPISSTDSILVVVDEEILGFGLELVEDLSPENIEKITVLKDENAVAKYGERAKKGVIEITTKITIVEIWGNLKFKVSDKYPDSEIPPYFVLDGEPIKKSKLKKINPEDIKHINVLKGETAIEKYGDKGKNGVIEITSKRK